mmetsp:Transcript_52847/g.67767  ORF Transcript_52847/g.67767 Transcript_52847/m.67767 type:complete len:122 (-) Transcript_52847:155-520(-)
MSTGRIAYRRLLKARTVAFRGDNLALSKAKEGIRQGFMLNRDVTDPTKLERMFQEVDEAEEMLRYHILQGKKNDRGNYDVKFTEEQASKISNHEKLTHIDGENIPVEPAPVITKHTAPKTI